MLAVGTRAAVAMRHTATRVEDPPERAFFRSVATEPLATRRFAEVAEGLEEGADERLTPQAGRIASPEWQVLGFLLAIRSEYLCFLSDSSSSF